METNDLKYVIISPVRNEENNIEKTIKSVLSQTIRPVKWVIVDDGSSDDTPNIVQKYACWVDWITLIKLADRGYYDLMRGGEIKAFYKGYDSIQNIRYDFLAKLDGDISFKEAYFEDLLREFCSNKHLGIGSGACYYLVNNMLVLEKSYKMHVRGAARVYRKECWEEIGGAINELAWDVVDVYKARMLGWETCSFEKIKMVHHVVTGTKAGIFHGMRRQGRVAFLSGMNPLFFCARALQEMFMKPYIVRSLAYILGYLKCFIRGEGRIVDSDLMAYIRREQLGRLALMIKGGERPRVMKKFN